MPRVRYLDRKVHVKITKHLLKRIMSYFLPYWKHMLVVFLALAVSSVMGLIPPLLIREIIDKALPGKDLNLLALLTLASLGATIFIGLVGVGESYLVTWISAHIIYDIKNAMYKHLSFMSLRFFTQVKSGDIITRMTSDINGIANVFRSTVIDFTRNLIVLTATAVTLILMNWKLAVLGLFIVPFFALPTRRVGKIRWKIASETQEKQQELNQITQETLSISGSILMKIFNRENSEYNDFNGLNQAVTNLGIRESIAGRWFRMVISIFTTIGPMLIYFYGGYLFIRGEISIGEIVAFVALLNRLYGPVLALSNIHIDLTRSLALFERIFEYLDKKHEIADKPDAASLNISEGRIEFTHVCFAYNKDNPVLKDISFTAEPGSLTALVGPSGAGKSTITYLIPRLYDVNAGSVRIDGFDVRDVTQESLRRQIGMVMQESYLFNASVRDNLLYAKDHATDGELIAACKAANIHDFIMALPNGYDTVVGNRGIKLSGGEKQRVAIARVLLKDPKIIILDEATSSLDSVSEHLIQSAIEPLLKGRTSIVIAHRLSTILAADKILVLEEGRIAEAGSHEELLAREGLYKLLYDTQFRRNSEEDAM